jgi:hypothetical protein
MNATAYKTHGNDADLETMAKKTLERRGGRLLPTLRRLEAAGWITVEGESLAFLSNYECDPSAKPQLHGSTGKGDRPES